MTGSLVSTEITDCRDCYRCIRECVPKAIRVSDGHAQVQADRCVLCGHCVSVCPAKAKRVRNDLVRAQSLLLSRRPVYASLAPSVAAEFSETSPYAVAAGILKLGFIGVSETALGAEIVARHEARAGRLDANPVRISSACPSVVELIEKYHPELVPSISPTLSPALTHAKMLREHYGEDIGVVFISPCIAKKQEADAHPELIDVAITFEDLETWFSQTGIDVAYLDERDGAFVPYRANHGAGFPVEGGMIRSIARIEEQTEAEGAPVPRARRAVSISGLAEIREALIEVADGLASSVANEPLYLELQACRGGCIRGPGGRKSGGALARQDAVRKWQEAAPLQRHSIVGPDVTAHFTAAAVATPTTDSRAIREALSWIGKHQKQDELNCGSCGYDTCRSFAAALVGGLAEQTMCVGHMRKIAQKKTDALLRAMPSAVVIVDRDLTIRECNQRFASLAGEEAELLFDAKPGMGGISVKEIVPFWELFADALEGNGDTIGKDLTLDGRVLSASVFVVEAGSMVGGVFDDVTAPSVKRERIIDQAESVIRKNLATVQQIAHLMGENAAETEALLSSIITAFGNEEA
ncbi:MAG: [Fe-Fe] hydrogenase large subunit C-terminal domain-containing protein [Spirochaetales bacterium]